MMELKIRNLKAGIDGKEVLKGIDLDIKAGEVHALMGPNGSGKSTLANVLMGHPLYRVAGGSATLDGNDLLAMTADERARQGMFLAFQYPVEVPGITIGKFLKRMSDALHPERSGKGVTEYLKEIRETMDFLKMDSVFINRYLNEGFSGGEKKKAEILQMMLAKPGFALLDETDSGLDIDALKSVAAGVNRLRGPGFACLIITHYQRILDYIRPDRVHIMVKGKIVRSGGEGLVHKLESEGYDWLNDAEIEKTGSLHMENA